MNIVRMTELHLSDIYELEQLSFTIPWSLDSFKNELNNTDAVYFCAVENEKAIGYAGMWCVWDEGQITNIAVHPKHRKCGAGGKLINALIDDAISKKIERLFLEVRVSNASAISLYFKFGFEECGIRKKYYADNLEDALVLRKKL